MIHTFVSRICLILQVFSRGWWSKVCREDLGTVSDTNSSHSHNDAPREDCFAVPTQLAPFDCTSVAPLQDGPATLALPRPCLFSQHLDTSAEVGDKVDSHKDKLVFRQSQQVLNKRPHEGAMDDNDVNFCHKKKKVFRPSQFDGCVSLEKDVSISFFLVISSAFVGLDFVSDTFLCLLEARSSCSFDLVNMNVHPFTEMLFRGNLPTAEEIRDLPDAELVPNSSSYPSLMCVGISMQELIMRPTLLPTSSEISFRVSNLNGTKQLIHRINPRAAIDIKSHIKKRISNCLLEDLTLLKKDLSKLVSTIDNLNVDSSFLRVKIVELMVA
ncbi:hypothetical protein ACFX1Q_007645 [Malus domestica]